jgi:hypothetical protein
MTKQQYCILIVVFFLGMFAARLVDAQEISGPTIATSGRMATFDVTGVEAADWWVSQGCDMSVDSNTLRVYVTPYRSGLVTLNAAVIVDGSPRLLHWKFQVTGIDYDKDGTPSPNPNPQPQPATFEEWVRQNVPVSLSATQRTTLAIAFASTASNIDSGAIRTLDNAFNAIRSTTTPYFGGNEDVVKFLGGISEKTKDQGLQEFLESCKIISVILQGTVVNAVSQDRTLVTTALDLPVQDCKEGTCPPVAKPVQAQPVRQQQRFTRGFAL